MRYAALALLLAGCGEKAPDAAVSQPAGAALERAALAAELIHDPAKLDPAGAYASDTDRICIVPAGAAYRFGASVDYGDRQACIARGTASGRETLRVDLGEDCRFDARFDGQRIVFPATLPPTCGRRCTGRATLTALSAALLSHASSEAKAMQAPDGEPLCG